MGSGPWLRLLLALAVFCGIRAQKIILGTLGKPTILQIPPEFQERARSSGEASWKKSLEEPQKKKFLLKLSGPNFTEFERGRIRFHREDFSLEILNTSREDERLYEFSVSAGPEESLWQIHLRVFEPVSELSVRVLGRAVSNGSCSLWLRCSSGRGDGVSFSWRGPANATGGVCSAAGAALNLSYSPRDGPLGCVCTASNAVSRREVTFEADQCGDGQWGDPGLRPELLVPLVTLGVIAIIVTVVFVTVRATRRARGDRDPSLLATDPSQATPDPSLVTLDGLSPTIYAQVQRVQRPPRTATIYATATGPPATPEPPPRPPAGSPNPRGHPRMAQEPTTVYARVTLPVA